MHAGDAVSHGSSDVVNSEVADILTPEDIRLAELIFQDDDIINGAKQDINSETSSQSTDSLTRQLSKL